MVPPRRHHAFTLIEIMVVIVVLGIVAAMAAPNLAGVFATMQLRGAAADLRDMMDYCYRQSVATGRVHALVFRADDGSCRIVAEPPVVDPLADDGRQVSPTATPPPRPAPADGGDGLVDVAIPGHMQRRLPPEITVAQVQVFDTGLSTTAEGDLRLLFFPDGTCEFAELTLLNRQNEMIVVTLNGLTGMIDVGEVEPYLAVAVDTEAVGGGMAP